jgi:hypothetical protein
MERGGDNRIVQRSLCSCIVADLEQSLPKIAQVESAVLATVRSQPDEVFETMR